MYPSSSGVVSEKTLLARHALDAACDELLAVGSQHTLVAQTPQSTLTSSYSTRHPASSQRSTLVKHNVTNDNYQRSHHQRESKTSPSGSDEVNNNQSINYLPTPRGVREVLASLKAPFANHVDHKVTLGTQTSPTVLSRSSSFTWLNNGASDAIVPNVEGIEPEDDEDTYDAMRSQLSALTHCTTLTTTTHTTMLGEHRDRPLASDPHILLSGESGDEDSPTNGTFRETIDGPSAFRRVTRSVSNDRDGCAMDPAVVDVVELDRSVALLLEYGDTIGHRTRSINALDDRGNEAPIAAQRSNVPPYMVHNRLFINEQVDHLSHSATHLSRRGGESDMTKQWLASRGLLRPTVDAWTSDGNEQSAKELPRDSVSQSQIADNQSSPNNVQNTTIFGRREDGSLGRTSTQSTASVNETGQRHVKNAGHTSSDDSTSMRARQMSDVSDKSRSTGNKHPPQSGTANRTPHVAKSRHSRHIYDEPYPISPDSPLLHRHNLIVNHGNQRQLLQQPPPLVPQLHSPFMSLSTTINPNDDTNVVYRNQRQQPIMVYSQPPSAFRGLRRPFLSYDDPNSQATSSCEHMETWNKVPIDDQRYTRHRLGSTGDIPIQPYNDGRAIITEDQSKIMEREALESCQWLRAAGFPQYAQMFEEKRFPIDLAAVASDHSFLDDDSLSALYRRLHSLNSCAIPRNIYTSMSSTATTTEPSCSSPLSPVNNINDISDEDESALSRRWRFERKSRTWSRIEEEFTQELQSAGFFAASDTATTTASSSLSPQHPRRRIQNQPATDTNSLKAALGDVEQTQEDVFGHHQRSTDRLNEVSLPPSKLQRSQSERIKNRAKALMRRMDLRATTSSNPSNKITKDSISGPQGLNGNSGGPVMVTHAGGQAIINAVIGEDRRIGDQIPESSSDTDHQIVQTRRDSGVGSSLSRSPATQQSQRQLRSSGRWNGLNATNGMPAMVQDNDDGVRQLDSLCVGEMMQAKKLALIKLTALLEKHLPSNGNRWASGAVHKLIRKIKATTVYSSKTTDTANVFGVPLHVQAQRTGVPMPQCMLFVMYFLREQSTHTVGMFRRPGVRSRINVLRAACEMYPDDMHEYGAEQTYDVADMLKQYFRDLPEPLCTNKLSETFLAIHMYIGFADRMDAMRRAIVLLPDENREVLHTLLHFLHDISLNEEHTQMNAKNLSICFIPTLFQLTTSSQSPAISSPHRRHKTIGGSSGIGIPSAQQLAESEAAQLCLTMMIEQCHSLFTITPSIIENCVQPPSLAQLGAHCGGWRSYMIDCANTLLKEHRDGWKRWLTEGNSDGVEVSSKKVTSDSHPLKLWRCWVEVPAPPAQVHERQTWDDDVIKLTRIAQLGHDTDVVHLVLNDMPPHPTRDFCMLRLWQEWMPELHGGGMLVETSITDESASLVGGVRAFSLASRYAIEPSPAVTGHSRLTYIARVDTKGRGKAWYNRIFGHLCARHIARLRDSFSIEHQVSGPETNV